MSTWWAGAVGYQIYIRSFADGDGDGIGDLAGIRGRLDYLAGLGIDIVWITPFYPSPQADHGYDVADYTGVDPTFGSIDDVRALVDEAHDLGLRVVIDLVPNHSSDRHPWFVDARQGPQARHRDWYVWRDGRADGSPPNNWVSNFGGPAWTRDPVSGQWYMHLFLPEQPDLNWANEEVRAAFDDVLRFWAELGVDGFRIDVAHSLVEDPEFRDNPLIGDPPSPDASPSEVFDAYEHRYDHDQPGVIDIYRRWSQVLAEQDGLLLGEVYLLDPERVARYVRGGGLDLAFCFPVLRVGWDTAAIRSTLETSVAAGGDAFAWPLSSHDDPHAAERFGGGSLGARRARAYLALLCGLPGVPFLFQGDELGLDDGQVAGAHADPIAVRNPGAVGRDGSRTPMIWEPGPGHGFSDVEPWLPFGRDDADDRAASVQAGDPGSPLERTRQLLAARRELDDLRDGPDPTWLDLDGSTVAFRRGEVTVVLHVGADPPDGAPANDTRAPMDVNVGEGRLVHATADGAELVDGVLTLPPDTTVYVHHRPHR